MQEGEDDNEAPDASLSLLDHCPRAPDPGNGHDSPSSSSDSDTSSSSSSSSSGVSSSSGLSSSGAVDNAEVPEVPRSARAPGQAEVVCVYPPHGELRYSTTGDFIRAHCWAHGAACRKQRACNRNPLRPGQGRPVGLLTHWLQTSRSYETAAQHKAASVGSVEARRAARASFLGSSLACRDFAQRFEAQRERDDEDEPRYVP